MFEMTEIKLSELSRKLTGRPAYLMNRHRRGALDIPGVEIVKKGTSYVLQSEQDYETVEKKIIEALLANEGTTFRIRDALINGVKLGEVGEDVEVKREDDTKNTLTSLKGIVGQRVRNVTLSTTGILITFEDNSTLLISGNAKLSHSRIVTEVISIGGTDE